MSRNVRLVLFTLLALTALGIILYVTSPENTEFTAGEMSRAHAELVGEGHCADCHESFRGVSDSKCLVCHEPLAERITAGSGYHAQVSGACTACHKEHLGAEASIILWPDNQEPSAFDHRLAGYTLDGAHESTDCEGCHRTSLVSDPVVAEAKEGFTTFLGLSTQCAGCHQDPHVPTQGQDCAECHSASTWEDPS
ncbi:cytochrome c3 family protein, partial [Planctomycetota bacterium]|nr:cytochrome c3 family protein [Planctomycetota bacterium]